MSSPERLFTPRFFLMCGFSFTVFLSAFQLLPTAPYRILDLGGTAAVAGLFLGFLTYSSAWTAPFTGTLVDRVGPRRILIVASLAIMVFSLIYAVLPRYGLMLGLVIVHGCFWSGLLSASGTYVAAMIPASRRAEGIGYWGLSAVLALAVAPTIGLWVYERGGWTAMCLEAAIVNLVMATIAWTLPEGTRAARAHGDVSPGPFLEWRVLFLSITLFLCAFAHGGVTSFVALYADRYGVRPRALYFTLFAVAVICTRPFIGRLADQVGYRRVFLPCLTLVVSGMALLAVGGSRPFLVVSALLFGTGFGSAYPIFLAYVLEHVDESRRGATFGSIIGALDTGIGTGSIAMGAIIQRFGFPAAWGTAAVLAALAIPFFIVAERSFLRGALARAA